jgi:hypothetical protein
MIPRTLHFIWINKRDFGEGEYCSVMSALQNTTYDVILHTDSSNIPIQHPRFSIHYMTFSSVYEGVEVQIAHISDIWRIRILQMYGGLYSDCDILWLKELPIDPSATLVATYDLQSYKHLTNSFLGAVKGHPALQELEDGVCEMLRNRNGKTLVKKDKPSYFAIYKVHIRILKLRADQILHQSFINKNTHARIGRAIARTDSLRLKDISAFNWYNSMYPFDKIKLLLQEYIQPLNPRQPPG